MAQDLSNLGKETAVEKLTKFLSDNNIEIKLSQLVPRAIEGGSMIIELPQLLVTYKDQK